MFPGMPNESYLIIGVKGSEVRFGSMHLSESTEVQLLSFVCSIGGKSGQPGLWNIQNLGAVPP